MTDALIALCLLAVAYCCGGLHGLYLAWTQELRIQGWARRVCELHESVKDAYARGSR